ncbi:MAG: glutamyl-tRNA amidotransferase [Butyrivibrio sp.]|uniref:hypothetical protein n=1 Tax=Butyrivibrio sp. NC2002 TaxID=1410610 RepID=UPI00056CE827|nr:hypothetical protein [Butyrivibrio sp. NC2002]MBE5858646.1 glutamyl-tRNA amidotransferase [Butyrivibrio sp.]
MVLVDLYVPALDKDYNFSLNENIRIGSLIAEITEMIEQKERTAFVGNVGALSLFDREKQLKLPKENTLKECYEKNGTKLILI